MIADMLDTARSLTAIMEAESAELNQHGRHADHAEIATAKARLVGQLEAGIASLTREMPDWAATLDDEDGAALRDAIGQLRDAAAANAAILDRQLNFSNDMMAVIAAEAKRIAGSRSISYQATGGLIESDGSRPISVNTSL